MPDARKIANLKNTLQVFAGVIGFIGLPVLLAGFAVAFSAPKEKHPLLAVLVAALLILIGAYLVWIAYTAIRQFSPKAVLHLCGAMAVFIATLPQHFLPRPGKNLWLDLIGLAWFLLIVLNYRKITRRLNTVLFSPPDPDPEPQPEAPEPNSR